MRQIKYRIWDNDNKVMEFIDFTNLDKLIGTLDTYRDYFSSDYFNRVDEDTGNPLIMQFIGLLDVNGKEVYEGDIVKFEVNQFILEIVEGVVTWKDGFYYCGDKIILFSSKYNLEIIGNIYNYKK